MLYSYCVRTQQQTEGNTELNLTKRDREEAKLETLSMGGETITAKRETRDIHKDADLAL